jgi:hypothetical protein
MLIQEEHEETQRKADHMLLRVNSCPFVDEFFRHCLHQQGGTTR